jgi:predicted dehydrogenase
VTVRIGFLGAGKIADYHRRLIAGSDEPVEWAGVYDPVRARADAFAASTGAPVLDDPVAVIETADAVYVVTWTSEHLPLVEAACAAGRAVFCEKPLGRDLSEARAVAEAVRRSGVVNQVGLVLRRSPLFWLLRSVVDEPASGPAMVIDFRDDQYIPVRGGYQSTWRGDVDRAGSGVLLEHSIHDVDLLEWMLGPISTVSATTASHHGIPGIEDVAVCRFEFASGAQGTLTTIWHDIDSRISNRSVEVFCMSGYGRAEGEWYGTFGRQRGPDPDVTVLTGDDMLAAAAAVDPRAGEWPDSAFLRSVRSGEPCSPDVLDALRAHVIVDACYRSASSGGTVVTVPER